MSIFKVKTEEDKITVHAELKPYDPKYNPRKKITTGQAESFLKESGIEHGKCLNPMELCNSNANSCTGTWIFEKKTTKPLDKPAEKVILSKENKPAPKKRKSRAKKKTTK